MKHNWEHRRLGEVCEVVGGSTPSTQNPIYWNGDYNWFTPAEISSKKFYYESERKITEEGIKAAGLKLLPKGTVLLTSRAPIGKVGILMADSYCNQGFKNLICKEDIYNEFLYHSLIYFNEEIKEMGSGSTFKEISKKVTENIKIPIPPLKIQNQIVSELDAINAGITTLRDQVKDLDKLAQSLFYETFGDPITNPKAWDVKKIGDIFCLKAGKAINASELLIQDTGGLFPCYGGNGIRGYINRKSHSGSLNIIGRQGALCGNVTLAQGDFYATEHAVVVNPIYPSSPLWIYHVLTEMNLNKYSRGVAQPGLSVGIINEVLLPVPPLELQEQFASQIEKIETLKSELENQIAEAQTLLNSRMDYWFH